MSRPRSQCTRKRDGVTPLLLHDLALKYSEALWARGQVIDLGDGGTALDRSDHPSERQLPCDDEFKSRTMHPKSFVRLLCPFGSPLPSVRFLVPRRAASLLLVRPQHATAADWSSQRARAYGDAGGERETSVVSPALLCTFGESARRGQGW